MSSAELNRLELLAAELDLSRRRWRTGIAAAAAAGHTLRQIAPVAGVSVETVRTVIRQEKLATRG